MLMYILGALAVILSAIFIVVRVTKGGLWGVYTKTLASVGFIVLGIFGIYVNGVSLVSVFILLGLIFGLIGDIVLDLKIVYKNDNDSHLNAGMVSFGIGHIMYFIALVLYLSNSFFFAGRVGAMLLISLGISMMITVLIMNFARPLLHLDFGKFNVQTAIYTFMLSFMTAFSITAGTYISKLIIFAVGLLLFFLSDLVLSNQYFGKYQDNKLFTIINHILYYLGQITIAVMIYFI